MVIKFIKNTKMNLIKLINDCQKKNLMNYKVERYFKENNFNTLVINILTNKNNYDILRKTKTDTKDCMRLAKLFFVNEVEYHDLSSKSLIGFSFLMV